MNVTFTPTSPTSSFTPTGDFTIVVTGDFRGSQLHIIRDTGNGFASQAADGADIFDAPGSRKFASAGEDVLLRFIGDLGSIEVQVLSETETAAVVTTLTSLLNAFNATVNPESKQLVEPLGRPTVARQLTAGAVSANTALTTTCRRISIRAVGAAIRFSIGSSAQAADGNTSHFIADGERLDFSVPATPNIAVTRDATTDGVLELTELI